MENIKYNHIIKFILTGFPRPTVKWWAGDKVLKSSHGPGGDGRVENRLVVVNISRAWHDRVLTCIANNTHLRASALASLTVNMTCELLSTPKTVQYDCKK